jgi:chromate transport protein ChrA
MTVVADRIAEPGAPAQATLLDIAMIFGVISTTAFGGSAIVMMRREMVARRQWFTEREFLEIYTLAQVCPGGLPISIAVLCGKRLAGLPGFFVALIAETVPGFIVLMVLALLSFDPHMTLLRAGLRGAAAAALGSMVANALQMSYPFRKKIVDLALMVIVGLSVVVLHFALWSVFLVFLPISIALVRLLKEE